MSSVPAPIERAGTSHALSAWRSNNNSSRCCVWLLKLWTLYLIRPCARELDGGQLGRLLPLQDRQIIRQRRRARDQHPCGPHLRTHDRKWQTAIDALGEAVIRHHEPIEFAARDRRRKQILQPVE